MLSVIGRSHRGRTCEFSKDDLAITTPYIIRSTDSNEPVRITMSDEGRILSFFGSDIGLDRKLMTSASSRVISETVCKDNICVVRAPFSDEEDIPEDAEFVVIPNGFELRKDPRKIVDLVIRIREKIGYNRLLCILGIAEPSTISLLSYMGVDMFDDSLTVAAGLNMTRLIPEGEICVKENASEKNVEDLLNECDKVRTFIDSGRLRELVDQRVVSSPSSVATLRIFDDVGYGYQEEACSTVGTRLACNTTQALRRPDLKVYRDKISNRYRKPEHKRILLLLPCSAKKPYHISKSH